MVYFSLHPMECEGMAADYCAYVMLIFTMRNCDVGPVVWLTSVMVVVALLMPVMLITASLVAKVPGSAVMSPEAL